MWTDNVTLNYFSTQPKLSSKQVRWQDTLALFNVDIRHKPRKEKIVPDALSHKHQFRMVYVGETELQKEVQLASHWDAFAKEVRQKHPKWSQVPLPFAKCIIVVQTKSTLCAGREDEGHTFERMS